jgi:hypothetical protein
MKSSQNIQRLGHTKFTSCSSDFVLKTLERASDLKVDIKIIGQVCLQCSELKKIIYLGFVPSGGHWAKRFFERASDLKMLISFPFFACLSFLMCKT